MEISEAVQNAMQEDAEGFMAIVHKGLFQAIVDFKSDATKKYLQILEEIQQTKHYEQLSENVRREFAEQLEDAVVNITYALLG
jgi:hypothetical protein